MEMNKPYKVGEQNFEDWTQAQGYAWTLLMKGVEYVRVFIWNEAHQGYGLLQELNLRRGVAPNPNWGTWYFAPYFWRQMATHEEVE